MQSADDSLGCVDGNGQWTRTLVIGCGFIGSHIVEALVEAGCPPVVLSRSRPAEGVVAMLDKGDFYQGEVSDREALDTALDKVGHVVFSAGGLLPAASEQNPQLDAKLTLDPVRSLLDVLSERPDVALTYLSSGGTIYGEPRRVPVNENAPIQPLGVYGELHRACEELLIHRRVENGLRTRILRCATVYGEYQQPDRGQGAVVTFLHRIEQGRPIHIFGDGTTVRDYVYARDLGSVVASLLDRNDGPPILNVGSGQGTSLLELVRMAEDEIGCSAQIIVHPKRQFEVHRIFLDTTRLRRIVDFEATMLKDGIARTNAWLAKSVLKAT